MLGGWGFRFVQIKGLAPFGPNMDALISIAWIIVRIRRFKFFHIKFLGAQMAMP